MTPLSKKFLILILSVLLFLPDGKTPRAHAQSGIPIIDSRMTFNEAVGGTRAPRKVVDTLCLIDVRYFSFDGRLHQGQLVIHKSLKEDLLDIFNLIEKSRFPVGKAVPIVRYGWSDGASMKDNNTSAFNYRLIKGTKRMSRHALGRAVDINPRLNPFIHRNSRVSPEGATYNREKPGTLHASNAVVQAFLKKGWRWGGHLKGYKDYHHFDKPE